MFKKLALTAAVAGSAVLAPAATQAADIEAPLKKKMWDEDVHTLQQDLKELGFFDYNKSTGYFGDITQQGVKNFQKEYGLDQTGTVDQETAEVLNEATELIERGDRGKAVEHLQKHLEELKLYDYKVDGIFGPITEKAVTEYQEKNDLQVDGIAGPETKAALFELREAVQKDTEAKAEAPKEKAAEKEETKQASADEEQKTITMEATAYTANCDGCSGVTATGIDLNANPDQKVVAVDPDVIPLGTEVYVEGYGRAIAGDTGGAINGNKIDLYMQSKDDAVDFGRKQVEVTILG